MTLQVNLVFNVGGEFCITPGKASCFSQTLSFPFALTQCLFKATLETVTNLSFLVLL